MRVMQLKQYVARSKLQVNKTYALEDYLCNNSTYHPRHSIHYKIGQIQRTEARIWLARPIICPPAWKRQLVRQNEHDSGMALCMYVSIISTVPSKKCSILHCVGRALL